MLVLKPSQNLKNPKTKTVFEVDNINPFEFQHIIPHTTWYIKIKIQRNYKQLCLS